MEKKRGKENGEKRLREWEKIEAAMVSWVKTECDGEVFFSEEVNIKGVIGK